MLKKVLIIACSGLGNGGVQNVIMNTVRGLHNEYKFDIIIFNADFQYYREEFLKYGNIYIMPDYEKYKGLVNKADYYFRGYRVYKFVKKVLQENGPYDIIHCNNEFRSAPCLKAAYDMGVPIRISHFHTLREQNPFSKCYNTLWQNISAKMILKYKTDIINCSGKSADSYFGRKNSLIIYNPIDFCKFDIKKYNTPKRKHSFVHIGRITENKNQKFVAEVFSFIKKEYDDASLSFVGWSSDRYIDSVKKTVSENGLSACVDFLPHDTDIPKLLSECEYMIFPSKSEGFGIVVVEAQAMGVECFISDAVPDDADAGLCTKIPLEYSARQWADIIINSFNHKKYYSESVRKFSLEAYSDNIRKIYK